jgi:hypothetical protein
MAAAAYTLFLLIIRLPYAFAIGPIPAVATVRVIWRNYIKRVKRVRADFRNKSDADAAA